MSLTLCHPDGLKSCGACCGCYNHRQFDEPSTLARLTERTRAFRAIDNATDTALRAFRDAYGNDDALVAEVPNCPFLGLLDLDSNGSVSGGRVGCLVHPTQLGRDARDCGVYDRATCAEFLCASHSVLNRDEQTCVVQATDTSYLYGLVITDPSFVRFVFHAVEEVLKRSIPQWAYHDVAVSEAWRRLFRLKQEWPFSAEDSVLGYVRVVDGELVLRTETRALGPVESIVQCLGTAPEQTADAINAIEPIVESVAETIVNSPQWTRRSH